MNSVIYSSSWLVTLTIVSVSVMFQVSVDERCSADSVPPTQSSTQLDELPPESPRSPISTPEPADSPRAPAGGEREEGSDLSSPLTNGELSEEEEVLANNQSILPCSVLDQASMIAEHFMDNLSRRGSVVSEDSLVCSSAPSDNEAFTSLSATTDLETKTLVSASSSPGPLFTSEATLSTPAHNPARGALTEREIRSTLSKHDRLLIHKIRRYYEYAEHQDENFSIKRRESLSYIPAGLVRNLSRQLNDGHEHVVPVYRKGCSRKRPTSWSVFDLPGLERNEKPAKSQKTESQVLVEPRARCQSLTISTTIEEELRPSSDGHLEEIEEDQQTVEEDTTQDVTSSTVDVELHDQPLQIAEEERRTDASSLSPPTDVLPVEDGSSQDSDPCKSPVCGEKCQGFRSHLPKIITLRTSVEEDQILHDMGKVKSKVFQLARQYSQRIKNNRPMVWQRNRETSSQHGVKTMSAVQEENPKQMKPGEWSSCCSPRQRRVEKTDVFVCHCRWTLGRWSEGPPEGAGPP